MMRTASALLFAQVASVSAGAFGGTKKNPDTIACGNHYDFEIATMGQRWTPKICGYTGPITVSTCGHTGSLMDTRIYDGPCKNDDHGGKCEGGSWTRFHSHCSGNIAPNELDASGCYQISVGGYYHEQFGFGLTGTARLFITCPTPAVPATPPTDAPTSSPTCARPTPAAGCQLTSCMVSGDPHYINFDGAMFDFHGQCEYSFLKDSCQCMNSGFEVQVRHTDQAMSSYVGGLATMASALAIKLPGGTIVELHRESTCRQDRPPFYGPEHIATNLVDGVALTNAMLPFQDADGNKIERVMRNGAPMITVTAPKVGVTLVWMRCNTIVAHLSEDSMLRSCSSGLCGNSNCQKDEVTTAQAHGALTRQQSLFSRPKLNCQDSGNPGPHCTPSQQAGAEALCDDLKGNGYIGCHSTINPIPYYEACKVDECALGEGMDIIADYEEECCERGIMVGRGCPDWLPWATRAPTAAPTDTPTNAPTHTPATDSPATDAPTGSPSTAVTPSPTSSPTPANGGGVSGDPFTSYKGRKTQFWAKPGSSFSLMQCGSWGIRASVFNSQGENQWFKDFSLVHGARVLANVSVAQDVVTLNETHFGRPATPTSPATVSVLTDEGRIERIGQAVHIQGGGGQAATGTTREQRVLAALNKQRGIGGPSYEMRASMTANDKHNGFHTVAFYCGEEAAEPVTFEISSVPAVKMAMIKDRVRHTHLDLTFLPTFRADAAKCTGTLPEIWGLQPLSEETSKMLIPPNAAKADEESTDE